VQDLREVCKTSAADRAAAEAQHASPDVQSVSPHSAIQLPTTGPAVIPGKLVNVTSRDSSLRVSHTTQETTVSTDRDNTKTTS